MDKEKYQERIERIKEVDTFVKTLDPSIREAAFKLLESYITGRPKKDPGKKEKEISSEDSTLSGEISKEEFFSQFDQDKPADNALLIASYYYSQYGTAVLTAKEAREIADSVGITVPNRIDVTFSAAKRAHKSLFQKIGRGKFKPTVHGEKFFKESYNVTKGTKTKAENGVE